MMKAKACLIRLRKVWLVLRPLNWLVSFSLAILGFSTYAYADESSGHHSKNHLSIIAGTSRVPDHNLSAFTLGFDFERELTRHAGVGVVAEHAFGDLDATSVFAVVDLHIGYGMVLQLGPGVEFIDDKSLAVGRFGLFQELHWGELVFSPSVSYDFTKEADTIVFGFALGTQF